MAANVFASPMQSGIALLEPVSQAVSYRASAATKFTVVSDGAVLRAGDAVRTDSSGRAFITYADGTSLVVEPSSDLVIEAKTVGGDLLMLVTQNAGRVWYQISRTLSPSARYEVRSGSLAAVVRAGSTVEIEVTGDATNVTAVEGAADATSGGETVTVTAGTGTSVAFGGAPAPANSVRLTAPIMPVSHAPFAPVATLPLPTIPFVTPQPAPQPAAKATPSSGPDRTPIPSLPLPTVPAPTPGVSATPNKPATPTQTTKPAKTPVPSRPPATDD